jgi:oligopeptide transport system ATP-binding protein
VKSQDQALLRVEKLAKYFPITEGIVFQHQVGMVHAVDGISFIIRRAETLGLVGESGCGKSTVGRTILQLYKPTAGQVYFEDLNLTQLHPNELRKMRRKIQVIFQDPYASLNPRMTVREIIGEPLVIFGIVKGDEIHEWVENLLQLVGLNPTYANRYPHEFSGGQLQRIGVARALASQPALIICDEPISALDASIRAQMVNLLADLQKEFGLAYLFIAHDLSIVKYISHRIAVMYLGVIVELASRDDLYRSPLHPYTQALLSAVPIPYPPFELNRHRIILQGELPSPFDPPSGCRFNTRCPMAVQVCFEIEPELREEGPEHLTACHLV